jgi:hypothetical protein
MVAESHVPRKRILHSERTGPCNPFNKLTRLGRLEIWHLLNDGTVAVVKTSIQVGLSAEFAQCVYKNS